MRRWSACAATSSSDGQRSGQKLLIQITLLSHPANTEREVRAYAEQLLVTPKYLSAVCKEKSGRTAMDWITESGFRH